MFDLRKILHQIAFEEINNIDLSHESCPDYSQTPEQIHFDIDEKCFKDIKKWQSIIVLSNDKFASSADKDIYIWDIDKRICINVIKTESNITALLSLPDGRLLSSHQDHTVKIWLPDSGRFIGTLLKQDDPITCMISFFENCLVTGGANGLIRMWSLDSGQLILPILSGHNSPITYLVEPDTFFLASVDAENYLIEWDIDAVEKHIVINMNTKIVSLAVDWRGDLYLGDSQGYIFKSEHWQSPEIKPFLKISLSPVYILNGLPEGNSMVAGGAQGRICFFNQEHGSIQSIVKLDTDPYIEFLKFAILSDGQCVIGGRDGRVVLLNFPKRALTAEDIWRISSQLEENHSVFSINLSNVVIKDNEVGPLLADLIEKRKDINIIGVPNLSLIEH